MLKPLKHCEGLSCKAHNCNFVVRVRTSPLSPCQVVNGLVVLQELTSLQALNNTQLNCTE